MKIVRNNQYAALLAGAVIAGTSAHAAVIDIPVYTLIPDGTEFGNTGDFTVFEDQRTDIRAANGNNTIVRDATATAPADPVAFFVTTFSFGTDTAADIYLNFTASVGQDRLGIRLTSGGVATVHGGGNGGTVQSFDFGSSVSGQTVTIIGKFEYDSEYSTKYGRTNAADDTIASFWINPTASDTEGSGLPDGHGGVANLNFTADVASIPWNSSSFFLLKQRIDNNSTPDTAGASSILNTTVLTGADATFANALALATQVSAPEVPLEITVIDYVASTSTLTLTWASNPGESYVVNYSSDMIDWDQNLNDGTPVPASDGSTTTAVFPLSDSSLQGEPKLFFRVEKVLPAS